MYDPQDPIAISIYKRWFRYATPNLFIWGPFAPAHDALFARATMARIQIALGIILIGGSFRKYSTNISAFRRRFSKFCSFTGGSSLVITGFREISYFHEPNSNPLYVEIQLARELSLLDKSNNGQVNKGNYWFGPKNFMPMNNEQYWKMVYCLEVNEIMADNYFESEIFKKYEDLLKRNFDNKIENTKSNELTNRINDIVKKNNDDIEVHYSLKDLNVGFKLFNTDASKDGHKHSTLKFWSVNNPFDSLQLQEYRDFYSYVYPRIKADK